MKLIYNVSDRPGWGKTIVFAFQKMIAIMAATLLVPIIMSGYSMTGEFAGQTLKFEPAAALLGAGVGTIVYLLFTKRRSPVFLGSSFTFLGAYAAVIGQNYGYWGVLLGITFAGLVYVVISFIIKAVGYKWVSKLMPNVIIGPIVTLIGLSLSTTATGWMQTNGGSSYSLLTIIVGLFTFLAIVFVSVKGSRTLKLIPFIIGVGAGYLLAAVLTLIGNATDCAALQIMSFDAFKETFGSFSISSIFKFPEFTIVKAISNPDFIKTVVDEADVATQVPAKLPALDWSAIANIAVTFIPIGIVELAQHIADHKNLSNIIEKDLIADPGLDKTLMGDGVGSIAGGIFGGAANTTYGESIGCVAITGNASIVSIFGAAIGCIALAFLTPFVVVIESIPKCVMGGACIAMYGFIAVSGLQMLHHVDLGNSKNLFVVSAILVCGIGGLAFNFGTNPIDADKPLLSLGSLAAALIVGIITNLIVNNGKMGEAEDALTGHVEHMGEIEDK